MKKYKITITGMHCASCASNIERSLRKTEGVEEASVSLMTHKAVVECSDSVKSEDLNKAVKRAGYKTISIEED